MLDKAEIRKEIARLEYEESSYSNYAKLADLYTIQKQMQDDVRRDSTHYARAYSAAPPPAPVVTSEVIGDYGDSDFLRAVAGKDPARVWPVVDELMDTLAMVNAKVYDSVMRKIQSI